MQRRLTAAGHLPPAGFDGGSYCPATSSSVMEFQHARGLTATGQCDADTWAALVEASWRLGDRLVMLSSPHMRGDDVADLQSSLHRLGFDCGRVDGIFGATTARAVEDFQRNCGLRADGVCGMETVGAVERLSRQSGTGPGVATLREVEQLRATVGPLAKRRIVVGQFGGLGALARTIARHLRHRGAHVITVGEPDAVIQASAANSFAAEVYLGFDANAEEGITLAYYAVPSFESAGGRSLAERIAAEIVAVEPEVPGGFQPSVRGMRCPVLRETRMTAVLCSLADVRRSVDYAPVLARAVVQGLIEWGAAPLASSHR